ncbi:MAG TPA: alkaline phosphatase PhoX [Vicinamibacterales bacterium]|nr:alkaline phosphatase PhoX [Vicinamibacterales bacterium]
MSNRVPLALGLALIASLPALAVSTKFSDFEPLTSSAPPLPVDGPGEATPITLPHPKWSQQTIADRRTQNNLVPNSNSGNWDMITSNETGPAAGRYLFMPFETGTAGVQRVDTQNPHYDQRTVTIVAPGTAGFVAGDASRWTPWGGYLTAEESWGTGSIKGRLFEVTNPVTAGPNGGDFIWRHIVPRVSHEGLAFDRNNTMYFIDELNGGSIYKYVSRDPGAASGNDFFSAGQTFVLRVGAGGQFEGSNGPAITGAATWVAITNATGGPIAGVSTVLPDGTIDGRVSADDNDVLGTGYNRPEDMELQTLADGTQLLYVTTTDSDVNNSSTDGTSRVYTINLSTNEVKLFAAPQSTDLATGQPVGGGLRNADNLAIDAEGNIYIIEDRGGGQDNDIWFAVDLNKDGDLLDAGEGLARWASNGTQGSEFTGLYFDFRHPNTAYVNIQHPSSGVDRLIEISASPKFQKGK